VHSGFFRESITGAAGGLGWGLIVALAEGGEAQPASLVTVKVYVPAARPVTVALVPDPVVVILSGLLIMAQVPLDGKPFSTTLPVPPWHEMLEIGPIDGAAGIAYTYKAKVATAGEQGVPRGLLVVMVIVTLLPASPGDGV
jgi:hypothetical protein